MPESRKSAVALLSLAVASAGLAACDRNSGPAAGAADPDPALADAAFVGGEVCAGCHEAEAARAIGSHHDLAMQPAAPATVLGDFDDAEFTYGDVTSRFYRQDGAFFVSTEGADGEIAEFELTHTFGVEPLQQYLIELAGGRVQALSIAWDSRPASAGGQRWFHLYPDEVIGHDDPLHWTGIYQSWNTMCADCHSTNLVKDYAPEDDQFATHFDSIDVDCEACHGPGSLHAADPAVAPPALTAVDRSWVFEDGAAIASRVPAADAAAGGVGFGSEVEGCARCHSRRSQLSDAHVPGDPLLDAFRPELLMEGLYHADGQILDEVYVYGSFLQSAMARAGVVCSDCHDPHSAELRFEGNAVCGQCHLASVYDQPEHHRHEPATAAAECVSCHMRAETYMVVDPRRDHSFRVPRPDLSAELDSPNACNDCHDDETPAWAAARVAEWYPEGRGTEPHFGQALAAGRRWDADGRARLIGLIEDEQQPGIARATAVLELGERMALADVEVLRRALESDEPLLNLAAIEVSAGIAPPARVDLVQRYLGDDRPALRTAAARVLLPARDELSARRQADLDAAIAEYLEIQTFNSDRPEGLVNAANVFIEQGRYAEAESRYREGIERHPHYPALYVNLADLYRITGRADESEAVLRAGLEAIPEAAGIHLALAFALVRSGRSDEALPHFRSAAELDPDYPYYAYLLAIAENDAGNRDSALELLRTTQERFPGYGDVLFALATLLRDAGDTEAALQYAEQLVEVMPGDTNAISLLSELEQQL